MCGSNGLCPLRVEASPTLERENVCLGVPRGPGSDADEDLPSDIARYQDVLNYASTPLDWVLGECVYIIPSDMLLRIDTTVAYNNNLLTNDSSLPWDLHRVSTHARLFRMLVRSCL